VGILHSYSLFITIFFMKKLTLVLSLLVLGFLFTTTTASAVTYAPGCAKGYTYSATTGQKCFPGNVLGATTTTSILRPLTIGLKSDPEVLKLQAILATKGYLAVTPDGNYGPKTTEAVRRFQAMSRLPVTGVVDSQTLAMINLASLSEGVAADTAGVCTINSFTATPNVIVPGSTSTLAWNTTDCQSVVLGSSGVTVGTGTYGLSGAVSTGPLTATRLYGMTVYPSTAESCSAVAGVFSATTLKCTKRVAVVVTSDICPNIAGTQTSIPSGMIVDAQGNCVAGTTNKNNTASIDLDILSKKLSELTLSDLVKYSADVLPESTFDAVALVKSVTERPPNVTWVAVIPTGGGHCIVSLNTGGGWSSWMNGSLNACQGAQIGIHVVVNGTAVYLGCPVCRNVGYSDEDPRGLPKDSPIIAKALEVAARAPMEHRPGDLLCMDGIVESYSFYWTETGWKFNFSANIPCNQPSSFNYYYGGFMLLT
jgi:peptidoglycan hydrolase-like protein with peptidoglycan-binding domain